MDIDKALKIIKVYNWVIPELTMLESGKSIKRYLPANAKVDRARSSVKGFNWLYSC